MKQRKGFTLIELLVVIAIIALLVSILLPSVNRARELAKRAVCKTRLKGLGTAFELFSQSEGGWMYNNSANVGPNTGNNLALLVDEGYASGKNFVCPSTSDKQIETITDADSVGSSLGEDEVAGGYLDSAGDKVDGYAGSYGFQACQGDGHVFTGTMMGDDTNGSVAIMADKSPDALTTDGICDEQEWSTITSDDDIEDNNSSNHSGDINNVLFKAGHVSEEDTANCGYDNGTDGPDGIYNSGGPAEDGTKYSSTEALNANDSVLVTTGGI